MTKQLSKVLSLVGGLLIAGGAISATALTAHSQNTVSSAAPVSSTVSSAVVSSAAPVSSATIVSSRGAVSNVADGIKQIQEATDKGVSAVNEAAKSAKDEVNTAGKVTVTNVSYDVVDPDTGNIVSKEPDYSRCKAELAKFGDDAGKVPVNKSKACQAALAALKAKASTQAPTK